ncbi:MAG: hypothetical protein ACRDN6_07755 [Gaiellaceae bacterium]
MEVQKLRDGLWRWTAPHPDLQPDDELGQDVGCVYYEAPETVVLIDPLVPAEAADHFWAALDRDVERAGRPVTVLLTVEWHGRSADAVRARYGAGSDVPRGVEAVRVAHFDEVIYWLPEHAAVVAGDVLLGAGSGEVRLCPDSWLAEGGDPEEFRASLRPLLDLPVELVLVSHGEPVLEQGHEALARALQT